MDRLASDTAFIAQLKADPEQALAEFDLSATERVALATNDEDGLRRLAGQDVAGFLGVGQLTFACLRPSEPWPMCGAGVSFGVYYCQDLQQPHQEP